MKMCDRCPGACNCLLDYNGNACHAWRKKNAPEVAYTNADRLSVFPNEITAKILTILFFDAAKKSNPEHYILEWLCQSVEEE